MSSTANKRLFVDANAMKHRLEAHIAAVRYKGIKDIPTSYESSNPTEYLRGYERGAIETANLALGHQTVDAVEVVRCFECCKEGTEECKMVHRDKLTGCLFAETKGTDFCSYGERRKDG